MVGTRSIWSLGKSYTSWSSNDRGPKPLQRPAGHIQGNSRIKHLLLNYGE